MRGISKEENKQNPWVPAHKKPGVSCPWEKKKYLHNKHTEKLDN